MARSVRLPNTHSGSTGCATTRSTSTKATSSSAAAPKIAGVCHAVHAHDWPPSSSPSTTSVVATVSSAAPA